MKPGIWISLLSCALLLYSTAWSCAQVSGKPVDAPVRSWFTVIDKDKKFVSTLSKSDIRVHLNGVPQEIISLERESGIPISLSVLIDVSISQDVAVPTTKAIGLYFVKSILRQGKDAAAIATFTGKVSVLQPLTTNLQNAQLAIHRLEFVPPPGYIAGDPIRSLSSSSKSKSDVGSTAIWDAISFTCEQILLPPVTPTKQVIVLLTDGVDSSSKHRIDEAIELAVKHNVIVYAIGVGDDHYFGLDEDPLRRVSERTGGRAFFPKKVMELPALFEEVEHELRNQYIVNYTPTTKKSGNSYRKLRIEVVNPEKKKDKLTLTYRPRYYPEKT